MKTLNTTFRKSGIDYRMMKRTDKVALFELSGDGYEVSRIYANEEYTMHGKIIPAGESISGNNEFGYDGSKAFFPADKTEAENYFIELNSKLLAKEAAKNAEFTHA